jgi:thymidylate kinase
LIIEFTGLPGSGKSTAAEYLALELAKHGITVLTARDLSVPARLPLLPGVQQHLALASSVVMRPRMAASLTLSLFRSTRSWFEKWYSFRHVVVTVTLLRRARRVTDPSTLTVLDEGVCQRVFQAFVDAAGVADPRTVRRFLGDVPLPDVVVGLKVPPETALVRVRSRGDGGLSDRFEELSDSQLHQRLADGQELLFQTLDYLEARDVTKVNTLVLDANDLPQVLQQLDTDCIPTLLRHLSPSSAEDV